jgi:hypothetical protein
MAEKLDPSELVDFEELLISNTIQLDTMYQLLIDKGLFTEAEFLTKMKQVQMEYQSKKGA